MSKFHNLLPRKMCEGAKKREVPSPNLDDEAFVLLNRVDKVWDSPRLAESKRFFTGQKSVIRSALSPKGNGQQKSVSVFRHKRNIMNNILE